MAEMNGRMNGSQCFPPPALCLRFPALQACTEDLPLVLQRPDSFPLVMGILQEINHENVGSSNRVDNTYLVSQRPRDQQMQTLALSKVKLENLDVEDHHQHSYNTNPDLYQEWSLKGVEELLTDSEELQLRHEQAHEAAAHLELASAQDEKPLFGLQFTHSQFNKRASDEAQLLVDEKPALCSQVPNSLKEQVPLQGRVLPVEEFSEVKPGLHAVEPAVLANNKTHQQTSQACVEDRLGLDNLQAVKREPEGHACCSEAQMQERCFLPDVCTSMASKVVHGKENTAGIIPLQAKDKMTSNTDNELNKSRRTTLNAQARKVQSTGLPEGGGAPPKLMTINTDCELNKRRKITLQGQKSQANKVQSSGLPELNLETEIKKRWTVNNILRSTSAILALPAEFTEQEVPQKPSTSNSLAAEGPMCPTVSSEGRVDSPQVSADCKGGDRKHQAVSSEAELDFCELTLSLGSSQPQTVNSRPKKLDCHDFPEEKPVVFVQEEHHGQCQRTNPNQWQQSTRCGSHKVVSAPAFNKKRLFPSTDGCKLVKCHTDREGLTEVMRSTSKSFDLYGSSADEMPEKKPLLKQGQPCLHGGVSRQTLQLMPQSSEDGGSALDEREVEGFASEDEQLAEPNHNVQPSQVSSQGEQASESNEPHKKRMRGTLPTEEKGDGVQKEKDTRCHRSDGKSWRCARECINGAYYCQYHLRARRIGYNRRKNRDTDTDHLESVSKKSSKGKKSRQLLSSTKNRNSKA